MPLSAICCWRSRAASMTAVPVMMVVRLPDSPTEYGQRSVSPQTTSTFDSGTPSASAAISPIVVFAPAPTSVTPTNSVYSPVRVRAGCTALLVPSPERNNMKVMPAPRLIGPGSAPGCGAPARLPVERLGAAADALLERVVGVRHLVARHPRHVLQREVHRVHLRAGARRRPSSTGCRRTPADTRARGSSPTPSGWCTPG